MPVRRGPARQRGQSDHHLLARRLERVISFEDATLSEADGTKITALAATGGMTSVLDIMTNDIPSVPEGSALESAIQSLASNENPAVALVDQQGRLIGYVNAQNLAEYFWIRSAQSTPVS